LTHTYGLSKHLSLERIDADICSKTSIIPPTYLDHLTSKIYSLKFCDVVVITHDYYDIVPTLPVTAETVTRNLLAQGEGIPGTRGMPARVAPNIEDPQRVIRVWEELAQDIFPVVSEEPEAVVVVQRRGSDRVSVCYDQLGADPMVLIG